MRASLVRLLRLAYPHRAAFALAAGLSVSAALLAVVPTVLAARIIGLLAAGRGERDLLLLLGAGMAGAVLLRFAARGGVSVLGHRAAYAILYTLRMRLAEHLPTLPLGTLSELGAGRIKKVMAEDVEAIELFFAHHLEELTAAAIVPATILGAMAWADARAAAGALLGILAAAAAHAAVHRDYGALLAGYHDAQAELNRRVVEYVRGLPVVRSFAASASQLHRFTAAVERHADHVRHWTRLWFMPGALFAAAMGAPLVITIMVVAWLLADASLSLADGALLLMLAGAITAPLMRLATLPDVLLRLCEGERRVAAFLALVPLPETDAPRTPDSFDVTFEAVGFRYCAAAALSDVSFTAPAGNLTVLVGPSGAGKSTAARLVPRFWDVESGRVLIGGVDVREIATDSLMAAVGFMFQEPFLFGDTVAENIRIGRPDATDDAVREAARMARCDAFAARLPHGYDTLVGAGGAALSGGERQRVALARAILKDAPILVLDEATAAVDAQTAADLHSALVEIARSRTLIVVTHDPALMALADRVVFLNNGRVSGCGPQEALLAGSPDYRAFSSVIADADAWSLRHSPRNAKPC